MDGIDDERSVEHRDMLQHEQAPIAKEQDRDALRFSLNWKLVFQHVFGLKRLETDSLDEGFELPDEGEPKLKTFLDLASSRIREGIKEGRLICNTLYVKLFDSCLLLTNHFGQTRGFRDFRPIRGF